MARLNLSIPPQIDAVLRRAHQLTGRSMAALALESLTTSLPHWQRLIRDLEGPSTVADSPAIGVKAGAEIKTTETAGQPKPVRQSGEGKAGYQFRLKAWEKRQRTGGR